MDIQAKTLYSSMYLYSMFCTKFFFCFLFLGLPNTQALAAVYWRRRGKVACKNSTNSPL